MNALRAAQPVQPEAELRDERSARLSAVPSSRPRARLFVVGVSAFVAVTLFGAATMHALLAEAQLEIDDVRADLEAEQSEFRALRSEVAALEDPERIAAEAVRMGMILPTDLGYLQPTRTIFGPDDGVADDPRSEWSEFKPLLDGGR